jgi:O-antigen/teichoic acid export membrane protein
VSGEASAARSLAGGALLGAAARVSFVVAGAIASIFIARLLGPEGSGQFVVISSLFFTLLALGTLGIDQGVAWQLGARRWHPASALVTAAAAALALGLVCGAAGMAAWAVARSTAFAGIEAPVALLASAALPPALLLTFFMQAAIASQRYEAAFAIGLAQSSAYAVGVSGLTAAFAIEGAAAGLLVSQLAGASVALVWGRSVLRGAGPGDARPDPARLRTAFSFGGRLWVANASAIFIYRFDVFLLNAYAGGSEAGYYAVAIAATTALGVLPAALGNVLFPRLASLSTDNGGATRRETEDQAIRHTLLLLACTSAMLAVTLPLLLEPVFGAEFAPALVPALILIPGAAALGLATTLYVALAGRGHPEYAMRVALVITPLAVGAYFLLVPALEAEGAALGSDLAYISSAAAGALCLRRVSAAEPGRPGARRRLLPGRSEIADYRVLAHQVRARLKAARGR